MYSYISEVLVNESKITSKLEAPVWMDKKATNVDDELEGYGCKVDIVFDRPDMGIVMDKVGCNLFSEMDNAVGRQRFLTSVTGQAEDSASTRNHHFMWLVGLTRLDGELLMFVVIITGKNHDDFTIECAIDWAKLNDFDMESNDLKINTRIVRDNFGTYCLLTGAPSCNFKGNDWALTKILRRINHLDLHGEDRKNGLTSFLLLDGHLVFLI